MPPRPRPERSTRPQWNGRDFYACFGERSDRRRWEDARRYGFVAGGGAPWYWRTLLQLRPGHRVFTHIPKVGYVGVGEVVAPAVEVHDFHVRIGGREVPILDAPLVATGMASGADDHAQAERLVRVRWLDSVPRDEAFWADGLFGNQNTVCKLRHEQTLHQVAAWFDVDVEPAD